MRLAIPSERRSLVGRRLQDRRRFALAGTILAMWGSVPLLWAIGGTQQSELSTRYFLVVGAAFAGGALGTAIGSLRPPRHTGDSAAKYSRPGAVGLDDYVAPLERRGAWVVVGFAVLIYAVSSVLNSTGIMTVPVLPPATIGGVMVLLSTAALLLFEVVGQRVVGRELPFGPEPEMVWNDQVRSADARGLATAPTMFGLYATVLCLIDLAHPLLGSLGNATAIIVVNVVGIVGIAILVLVGIYSVVSQPQRYFLRQLWPHFADESPPHPAPIKSPVAGEEQ